MIRDETTCDGNQRKEEDEERDGSFEKDKETKDRKLWTESRKREVLWKGGGRPGTSYTR